MSLSSSARKQMSQIKSYDDVPSWWTVLQVVLGVAFFLFLGYKFIAPADGVDPQVERAIEEYAERRDADAVTPGTAPTTGPETNASEGGTTTLPRQDGEGDATVPTASLDVAYAAAAALFTGDFAEVPMVPGKDAPSVPGEFTDPQVPEPVVGYMQGGTLITYAFNVDPDGPEGPEAVRGLNVTVQSTDGAWGWNGG